MMKRFMIAVCLTVSSVPVAARAQLQEMRQTIFGMD
jgi:hypothetical protein